MEFGVAYEVLIHAQNDSVTRNNFTRRRSTIHRGGDACQYARPQARLEGLALIALPAAEAIDSIATIAPAFSTPAGRHSPTGCQASIRVTNVWLDSEPGRIRRMSL